jgi:replicative DNA helicase
LVGSTETDIEFDNEPPPPPDMGEPTSHHPPPACIEAEVSVLGACLHPAHCGDGVAAASGILRPEHFFKLEHRRIFQAILDLHSRGETTDFVAVAAELESTGHLSACGGRAYLAVGLADSVFSAGNAPSHSRIVLDRAIKRDIARIAARLTDQCHNSFGEAAEILAQASADILTAGGSIAQSSIRKSDAIALDTLSIFDSYKTGNSDYFIPTPFTQLNDMLGGGLRESHYSIIAARPSVGKTSLAHNIAICAAGNGTPVGIFSLEMTGTEIVERMACAMARVDSSLLRLNRLHQEQFVAVSDAVATVASLPIFIDDSPSLTDTQIRSRSKTMAEKYGVKLIIIDYLQLLSSSAKSENRQQEVTNISRTFMAIPKETKTSLIALSQLSRDSDKVVRRPKLSDLRESGSLEQDANNVMFIHRDPAVPGAVELMLEKQRNGPTGTVKMTWLKEYTRFENYADEGGY